MRTHSICTRDYPISRDRTALVILLSMALLMGVGCQGNRYPAPKSKAHTKPYKVFGRWYHPLAEAGNFRQKGIASWYGRDFHGKKTSNGERYNMHAMTAAHKTLPLGTWVKVRNLSNGKTVEVRINDRGPFVRGRVIDLSFKAAKKLAVVGPGTAKVEVIALGRGSARPDSDKADAQQPVHQTKAPKAVDFYSGLFTFQVGAFEDRTNAQHLVAKLNQKYKHAHIAPYNDGNRTLYRVRVGRISDLNLAVRYEQILMEDGYPNVFTVAE